MAGEGLKMGESVVIGNNQHRLVVAMQYLRASESIFEGLQTQRQGNPFHFLITLRSFIEYTRRGIWFLAWAKATQLEKTQHLTFRDAGSPKLLQMDSMINEALGLGKKSNLDQKVAGVDEPYINLLHALTHGNPIAVRVEPANLLNAFDFDGLLMRAEQDLNIFRVLLYRTMLGEELDDTWALLRPIHDKRDQLKANVVIAAHALRQSCKLPTTLTKKG